jgi:hypothetical protein
MCVALARVGSCGRRRRGAQRAGVTFFVRSIRQARGAQRAGVTFFYITRWKEVAAAAAAGRSRHEKGFVTTLSSPAEKTPEKNYVDPNLIFGSQK